MFLTRIIYGIEFFVVLVVEIIKAILDTSICCLKGDVDPIVVKIKPDLERPVSLAILSNTITSRRTCFNSFSFNTSFNWRYYPS